MKPIDKVDCIIMTTIILVMVALAFAIKSLPVSQGAPIMIISGITVGYIGAKIYKHFNKYFLEKERENSK